MDKRSCLVCPQKKRREAAIPATTTPVSPQMPSQNPMLFRRFRKSIQDIGTRARRNHHKQSLIYLWQRIHQAIMATTTTETPSSSQRALKAPESPADTPLHANKKAVVAGPELLLSSQSESKRRSFKKNPSNWEKNLVDKLGVSNEDARTLLQISKHELGMNPEEKSPAATKKKVFKMCKQLSCEFGFIEAPPTASKNNSSSKIKEMNEVQPQEDGRDDEVGATSVGQVEEDSERMTEEKTDRTMIAEEETKSSNGATIVYLENKVDILESKVDNLESKLDQVLNLLQQQRQ